MILTDFPVIDLSATGSNIRRWGQGETNPNRFFRADLLRLRLICIDNTPVLSSAASLF